MRVVVLVAFVRFPGIADPNHYYNMGVRLNEGHGYTIDYIWQYNDVYDAVTHEDDHWMPMASWITAAGMKLFGVNVDGGISLFLLMGSLLPFVGYYAARAFACGREISLFLGAATAFVPEMVLNSVRTDTTIPNMLLLGAVFLLVHYGWTREKIGAFALAGVLTGLAYLTRSENLLVLIAVVVSVAFWALIERKLPSRKVIIGVAVMSIAAVLVAMPWILRTYALNGTTSTPTMSNMFYLTDHNDHYLFDRHLTLEGYLASQTPTQIIGKRLFEMAASVKIMVVTLDVLIFPVLAGAALLILEARREKSRWRALLPTLILLLGFFVFYTVLVPYKSQGGSFKKAFLSLIPLLLPLAGLALERAVTDERLRRGAMLILLGLLAFNALDLVRLDAAAANSYLASIEDVRDFALTLPDTNGDGQLVFMTQDPFILGYVGMPSVMYPMPDLDTVAEVVTRYNIDYLLMPAARPELDALQAGRLTDARFEQVAALHGTHYTFWTVTP